MPQRQDSNTKLPLSSSSISLNESPVSDEINYESDISEDENAIAEGEDGEDADGEEEGLGEGFEVEVSTLTGNTFSVMIHPEDTVEVLKTRIAFQEGISPADQNLVLEQGKLLDSTKSNNTLQELNIGHNSRLTLVTNVLSGVPSKNVQDIVNGPGIGRNHLWDSSMSQNRPTVRLLPPEKNSYNEKLPSLNPPQSSSLRLPKILTSHNNIRNNNFQMEESDNGYDDDVKEIGLQTKTKTFPDPNMDYKQEEDCWKESLFNNKKVANEEVKSDASTASSSVGKDDDLDIDSTTGRLDSTMPKSTRYGRKACVSGGEEEGKILVVKGDDGVILIIQKNAVGQLLDDSEDDNEESFNIDVGVHPGSIPIMRRYSRGGDKLSVPGTDTMKARRKATRESDLVHERIKENAVTLEKMKQVRSQIAQKNQRKAGETLEKKFEFPKISNGTSSSLISVGMKSKAEFNQNGQDRKSGRPSATARRGNNNVTTGGTITRSINSSKMSLNRLIAEIYLQSKRKGYAFQPGQPPYTEQQLLRYVQLKIAILLDEQRKSKTEPCSKCILDNDWNFKETAPYLIPTVVMNRYKRLSNSRSFEKDLNVEVESKQILTLRRKSMVSMSGGLEDQKFDEILSESPPDLRKNSQIPRLIHRVNGKMGGRERTEATTASTSSTFSRRSSVSVPPPPVARSMIPSIHNSSSEARGNSDLRKSNAKSINQYIFLNQEDYIDYHQIHCDKKQGQSVYFERPKNGLKLHQRIYSNSSSSGRARNYMSTTGKSSRPGSSNTKNGTAKKGTVRCPVCKKKIGLACRYQCRCGLIFCSIHRYPESHECTFDYKTEGRNKIRKDNPVIVAPKITEI